MTYSRSETPPPNPTTTLKTLSGNGQTSRNPKPSCTRSARAVDVDVVLSAHGQRHRPSFLHLRLRHAITAQDEACERIASAFIEGRSERAGASGTVSRVDSPAPGFEGSDRVRP